ncbi:hypothetical protein PYW08_016026 [Mythimna loreyi]|uniref:Uncharacterized protein n=1 Tax=Mythimna loreyi TaxID=667449 RepID=A0ACC2QSB7_9NEOP|nr:hypothetical protein PYW08_016026 [Mythimna loreyi]
MSSRGGRILRLSGHRLRQQYSRNGKTRWQCSTHMNKGCKAIVFTVEGGRIIRNRNVHNHFPGQYSQYRLEEGEFCVCAVIDLFSIIQEAAKRGGNAPTSIKDAGTFCETKRGARVLLMEGFMFYRHRDTGRKTRWYCATHYRLGCKAKIFTVEESFVNIHNFHNHEPVV